MENLPGHIQVGGRSDNVCKTCGYNYDINSEFHGGNECLKQQKDNAEMAKEFYQQKKEPTTEEKSRYIFEKLELGCWHEYNSDTAECQKKECDIIDFDLSNPNYFESDEDCRELFKTIERMSFNLWNRVVQEIYIEIAGIRLGESEIMWEMLKLTPAQKAEAVYQVLKSRERE